MADTDSVGFFDEFNAKYLAPEKVAEKFVLSKHFSELAGHYHTVLVGPRGSGKTTLLKMLQPAALGHWNGAAALKFRESINYIGVFIASDIGWSKQVDALGYGRLSSTNHKVLAISCFTTHVLKALIDALICRMEKSVVRGFHFVRLDTATEVALVRDVASTLELSPDIPSLLSLKQALANRLSAIRVLANAGSLVSHDEFSRQLAAIGWLHFDCLDIAANVVEQFNSFTDDANRTWALLFDELETAPDWIIGQLFAAIRTTGAKMLLKLAISPVSPVAYQALTNEIAPSPGQDHQIIRLWYSDRIEAKDFCESLWQSLVQKRGLSIGPSQALGESVFDPYEDQRQSRESPYLPGGTWNTLFARLAQKDASFQAFLTARHIELNNPDSLRQQVRDTVLRKAAPVAAVREFFLKEFSEEGGIRRTRKTSVLYAGANSLFSVSEGNPRWFIGLVSPLIRSLSDVKPRVPDQVQASEIDHAAERLRALVRTIPVPDTQDPFDRISLTAVLDTIGTELHRELVLGKFKMDPKLSFVVDKATPRHIRGLLAAGLNRGAVILIDEPTSQPVVGDIVGARLRLSYLLAAQYGLPLRRGKSKDLSLLIAKHIHDPDEVNQRISGEVQLDLLAGADDVTSGNARQR